MCGFIGFSGNLDNKEAILQKMMDRIVHRGPDMGGMYTDDGIALGFRRLSILDLSDAGAQPMANEDKSVVVVFNGEIYNYQALRQELQAAGHTFATAGDGEKKGTIRDKGIVNNKLSNALMQKLEKEGIPTHYVQEVNDRDTFVKKVEIVPLEVIVRNVAAGHFSLRMGVPEGKVFKTPILEYSYKNDDLHDPFINHYYALALDLATQEELDTIAKYALKVNEVLKKIPSWADICREREEAARRAREAK